jgi:rubrerythrin
LEEKMTPQTKENLEQAFTGEAKAYFRLQAFARRADEEGFPQIATLFRAVAQAEATHARNHFALLERVGSTQDNLRYAFEKETFVNEVAYPQLLRDAWADQDREAIWSFTAARNAEERHARLYKLALTDMVAERATTYQVCRNCGWVEAGQRPEKCPNCQRPAEAFDEVV